MKLEQFNRAKDVLNEIFLLNEQLNKWKEFDKNKTAYDEIRLHGGDNGTVKSQYIDFEQMTEFNIDLSNINIISKNIITLDKKETIFKCMDTFYSKKISLIPIIDKENGNDVFGYFYLKDIILWQIIFFI